ncbi:MULTISPECIES: response regulator [Pseudomonas]|uniref:response regulator n=1 Tax=Pseudomonas TaxID=286 RepID=UPI002149048D|nr:MULTISPECIES: response regulator [Pseudomonas]UUT23013.1 ATP-binding protein [Pseudomonas sp. T8]WJV26346.1 ATP-binding protein [Pseudomonas chlororaphis]
MVVVFDEIQAIHKNAVASLAVTIRRERLFFYLGVYLAATVVVCASVLAMYLSIHAAIERGTEKLHRHASEIGSVIQQDEVFVRRLSHTVRYYFSNLGKWEEGQSGDVLNTLNTSEEALGHSAFNGDFLIIFPEEGRLSLGANWVGRVNALANISAAGMSTLNAMKIERQAYVVGLNNDYAALFPAGNWSQNILQQTMPLTSVQILREKGIDKEKVFGVTEGIYWRGPYLGEGQVGSLLSCVGVVEMEGGDLVLFGSDVPIRPLLADIHREDEYGLLGLYSSNALLIDQRGANTALARGARSILEQPRTHGLHLTDDGIYLVEPVSDHFGYLVYGLSYSELLRSMGWSFFWLCMLSVAFLLMLLGAAYQWDKRVLRKNHIASRFAIEHEILNHILISAMPIGLFIVRARDYSVMRANILATSLMGMDAFMKLPASIEAAFRARSAEQGEAELGIVSFGKSLSEESGGKACFLHITYVASSYNEEAVFVCAVSDVTVQKLAELASMEAREESDRLLCARSNFFASVSHEIKAPLSVILGNIDLIPVDRLTEVESARVKSVRTGAQTLLQIVTDILDLSRIDAGEMQLVECKFYPRQCLERVAQGYAERAVLKNIEFHIFPDPSMERYAVMGDPNRTSQIIDNLLSNAFKFTHVGRVAIRGSLVDDGPDTASLLLEVIDSGIGMDERLVERLFTPFAQADGEARRYGGTGLGLSICATLCRLMGGVITAKSILHVGSIFSVRLPVAIAATQAVVGETMGSALIMTGMSDYGRHLQVWLTDWGWDVSIRESAVQELSGFSADVIVLADDNADCALDIANRTQVPVVLVRKSAAQRPMRLAQWLIEVTAFSTDALKEALQLAMGPASAGYSPTKACASEEEMGGKPSLEYRREGTLVVLVVDDSKLNRELLVDQIRSLGYGVLSAADGAEAVVMLRHHPVDIVLTDLDLPGMSGGELFDIVHRENSALPVVAVSGYDFDSEIERRLEQGFYDYIAKPVNLDRLSRVLERCSASHAETDIARERWQVDTLWMDSAGKAALAAKFQAHAKEELVELQQLASKRDVRALERWMHRMRGALLLIEDKDLAERCLEIELACSVAGEWCEGWLAVMDDIGVSLAMLCLDNGDEELGDEAYQAS